jgi:hypothetical protein
MGGCKLHTLIWKRAVSKRQLFLFCVPAGSLEEDPAHDETFATQGPLRDILRKRIPILIALRMASALWFDGAHHDSPLNVFKITNA